jgi:hypothetical protein
MKSEGMDADGGEGKEKERVTMDNSADTSDYEGEGRHHVC